MNILLVEDDPTTRNALRFQLGGAGHEVREAENGSLAMEILARSTNGSKPWDLLITDLRMGGMNGLDVIRAFQNLVPHTPAILITAYGDVGIQKNIAAMESCYYLEKPFGPERFLTAVSEALKGPDDHGGKP